MLALSDGPVLVAARPVFTTEGAGPPRGAMLMVRDLDYRLIAKISSLVEVPVLLRDLQRETVEPELLNQIKQGKNFFLRPIDEERVLGFRVVKDLEGSPRFLVSIEHDRSIWHTGKRAERALALSALTFGMFFCVLELSCASKNVIRPVDKIVRFIRAIKNDKDLHSRIDIRGPNEFRLLASQINVMLGLLHDSNQKLLAARERLQFEATHDPLTGAWNVAAALELLDRELARCGREQTTVAVILFDADHFKSVNDRFGHQAGDTVLQAITAAISRNLRASDALARYGGEEFLVIAPNCSVDEAVAVSQRILDKLADASIQIGEHTVHVTLSAGVAAVGAPFTAEDLIAVADRAMYRAKEKGRNCVEAEELTNESAVRSALYAIPRRLV
jgi:diguanylate cyclase (GGDEF)-like protein